jgi:fatty acid desaturase
MRDASVALTQGVSAADRNQIMQRFADAFAVRPWLYWTDMLGSALVGWSAFFVAVQAESFSALHVVATLVAVFGLLRAALFIHELAHLTPGSLPGFHAVWSALVGIPILVPSIMYVGSHMDHHRPSGFGTLADPEYAPIARWSRLRLVLFIATVAFVPVLLILRWGIVGPLSWLFPPLRKFVVQRLSTLVINDSYERPLPTGKRAERWLREEQAVAVFVWCVGIAVAAGWLPLAAVTQWIVMAAGVLVVNQVRTLAAHGYENEGHPVDSEAQLLDSINLTGWPLITSLIAPVGLRYHALHHHLPSLPYHSLGEVHRALVAELPADAPYRRTERNSVWQPVQKLWNEAPV